MDNQQAKTPSDIEQGWVAGFFDGEGHLGFNRGAGHARKQIQPRAIFTGTDIKGLTYLVDVLTRAGLAHYVYGPYQPPSHPKYWKPKWTVTLLGWKRLHRFLLWITPLLVIKREECELMLKLAAQRLSKGKAPWDEEDILLVEKIRDYSRRPSGDASQTTCGTSLNHSVKV